MKLYVYFAIVQRSPNPKHQILDPFNPQPFKYAQERGAQSTMVSDRPNSAVTALKVQGFNSLGSRAETGLQGLGFRRLLKFRAWGEGMEFA